MFVCCFFPGIASSQVEGILGYMFPSPRVLREEKQPVEIYGHLTSKLFVPSSKRETPKSESINNQPASGYG